MSMRSQVENILKEKFAIDSSVGVQIVNDADKPRTLCLIEHISLERRTIVASLNRLCRGMASALGGELYGTVNIDFASLGGGVTFDMAVEMNNQGLDQ